MPIVTQQNNFYNKSLKPFANQNRHRATKAEACLWKHALRAKQTGYTFNRQRPVLNYIVDFMCKPLKLIIEVDGFTHLFDEVKKNDKVRQENLEMAGFTVIRFTDNEVLTDIGSVIESILSVIKKLEGS